MRRFPIAAHLAAAGLAAILAAGCVVAPPVQEMSAARQAIAAAEDAGADRFARDELADARVFLAEAETAIAARNFGPARTNALRAQNRAMRALRRSLADEDQP